MEKLTNIKCTMHANILLHLYRGSRAVASWHSQALRQIDRVKVLPKRFITGAASTGIAGDHPVIWRHLTAVRPGCLQCWSLNHLGSCSGLRLATAET